MTRHLTILFLLPLAMYVSCQDVAGDPFQHKNSIQADVGGHGIYYSLNYERVFVNRNVYKTAFQLGTSYYPPSTGIRDIWIPIGINEIFLQGKHHLEAGLGYLPVIEASRNLQGVAREWFWSHLALGRAGYRFQKPEGRLILRVAFTPVLELDRLGHGDKFHPLGGISVGYAF